MRRDETPLKRVNPSGKVRWVARYTGKDGKRRSAGTFAKEGPCKRPTDDGQCCGQHAIWAAYEADVPAEEKPVTVRSYFEETWLQRWPRVERTEYSYRHAVKGVLGIRTQGGVFGEMPMPEVRAKHAVDLIAALFKAGRAASGVRNVMAVLSAMWRDAIRDDVADYNPMRDVTVRDNDPRVKRPRREPVLMSWEQMHALAALAGDREPMIRVMSDCGLRLGEMLALEVRHVLEDVLVVEQSAWRGRVTPGTKQGPRREAPLPPELAAMLAGEMRGRIGKAILFPDPEGGVWHGSAFYAHVWDPARRAAGTRATCHALRHSYVSLMRAAGADPADLARATGHTVMTASGTYTHSTGATFDLMRRAVG